jgi:hypothetical protein
MWARGPVAENSMVQPNATWPTYRVTARLAGLETRSNYDCSRRRLAEVLHAILIILVIEMI